MSKSVEISRRTILFIALFIFSVWLLTKIWDLLLLIFISFILMSALKPAVDRLEKFRIPRGISIVLIYLVLWSVVGTIIASIITPLIDQTSRLIRLLPTAVGSIDFFNSNQQEITRQSLAVIGALPENILKITIGLFGNLINVLTTIVITFYLLLERKQLDKYLALILGGHTPARITKVIDTIEHRLGSWVRGELVLMLAVGLLTYIGLIFLGVEIALPLALLAGLLEIVPNIGPTISAVPAILVAFLVHPLLAISTTALYFLIQFFENHLLVPKIMEKAVGVNPLVSIISLMVGFRLAGPAGAILAIPFVIVFHIFAAEFFPQYWTDTSSQSA